MADIMVADGNLLVNADGDLATDCGSLIAWNFTDRGFIAGGQDGAFREYEDPLDVSASPWNYINSGLGLRLNWEDDSNCADYNEYTQNATASAIIIVDEETELTIDWSGIGEEEAQQFDTMELHIDSSLIATAHAPGGGKGCSFGPIVSNPSSPQTVTLSAGEHVLNIIASTMDDLFHVDCWYQFELSFDPPIN